MPLCWIDVLTPKQAMFAAKLIPRIEEAGFEVEVTSRRYRELNEVTELLGLEARVVGRHGGGTLEGKLRSSLWRSILLAKFASDVKPDVSLSFASVEASRVAYGLAIPHVVLCDSPHAEAVARLSVPLARFLLTPWVIPKDEWVKYGIPEENVIHYKALDPWVWLRDFKANPDVLKSLNLDPSRPIVVCRALEAQAAYLLGRAPDVGVSPRLLRLLSELGDDFQLVVLPRYRGQVSELRKLVGSRGVVVGHAVDGPSLLAFSSVFVGGGGTMNTEAALLGVPTISCYPGRLPLIQRFLESLGLVYRILEPEEVAGKVGEVLGDLNTYKRVHKERARRLISQMEDPLPLIVSTLRRCLGD